MSNTKLASKQAEKMVRELAKPPLPAKYLGGLLGDFRDWAAEITIEPKEPQDELVRRQLVGARIKMIRQALGLKQSDLAKKLSVSTALITAYETGRREPSIKNLVALTQMLNVSADWLLGLNE